MYLDRRLGTDGAIPPSTKSRLQETIHLSNERKLYMRLTSPHEANETTDEFLTKTLNKMGSGRWCYAGPFQPNAFKKMPDVITSVDSFVRKFSPERTRVVLLYPNHRGQELESFLPGRDLLSELHNIPSVEVVTIDTRQKGKNGLILSDFFDFT